MASQLLFSGTCLHVTSSQGRTSRPALCRGESDRSCFPWRRSMPTEVVYIHGQKVETLRELLRPGLSAIFVGLNPSPVSVHAGHYYQGRLGLRFWGRLRDYGLTTELPRGREDEVAFEQGYGFTDLVRRPTARAIDLERQEISASVPDLVRRISA